jgi:capsular polysaccharide biosynthesis protein
MFWGLRGLAYRCYWLIRSLPFKAYFGMKRGALHAFWRLRTGLLRMFWGLRGLAYRCYWLIRSLPFKAYFGMKRGALHAFWRLRTRLLRVFWVLRGLSYHSYWFMRALPFKLRFTLRVIFYNYLFKYRPFKILRGAITAFQNHYFKARVKVLHDIKGRKYSLLPMAEFAAQHALDSIVIESRSSKAIAGPQFIGKYPFKPIGDPIIQLNMPRLEIYPLHNAAVIGGTNFICMDNRIVHPDEFLPERDVCPAELNGISKINLTTRTMSLFSTQNATVKSAVSMVGSCTGNYAHWLTETLPKLLLVDSVQGWEDYPLLVDAWIHPNFVKSIELFNKNRREIIRIKRWETVKVESLIEVTPPAYIPPEYRHFLKTKELSVPDAAEFPFSAPALDMLRNAAHAATGGVDLAAPQKIYLFRSPESCGNNRHVTNIDEIERIIKKYGYTMLDPAKLSFEDQIRVFSNARKIVSPLGAALANTIFTPSGCSVLGLSPWYQNANYYYFSNFMGALGHTMSYALGQQVDQWGHMVHKNYDIDLAAFKTAMKHLEAND